MMCEDFLWRHFMYAAKWSQMDSCLTNIALVCTIATLTWWDNLQKKSAMCYEAQTLCSAKTTCQFSL